MTLHDVFSWLSSPTTVALLSLTWLSFTLARVASRLTTTERKDPE